MLAQVKRVPKITGIFDLTGTHGMMGLFEIVVGIFAILGAIVAYISYKKTSTSADGGLIVDIGPNSRLAEMLKQRYNEAPQTIEHVSVPLNSPESTVTAKLLEADISKHPFGTDEYFSDFISELKSKENFDEISITIKDHE